MRNTSYSGGSASPAAPRRTRWRCPAREAEGGQQPDALLPDGLHAVDGGVAQTVLEEDEVLPHGLNGGGGEEEVPMWST